MDFLALREAYPNVKDIIAVDIRTGFGILGDNGLRRLIGDKALDSNHFWWLGQKIPGPCLKMRDVIMLEREELFKWPSIQAKICRGVQGEMQF
jgi:hypothetical protein